MKWGGFTPFTLSDFPGCVAAIAFTKGCNFNCPYCHNRHLIDNSRSHLSTDFVVEYLQRRKHQLDGLVISGGEPTCQPNLVSFVASIKQMGMKVKLDTNGTHPAVLENLISQKLVDYIAMDIKAPWDLYPRVTDAPVDVSAIRRSIDILSGSEVLSEFRVTAVSPLLTATDLLEMGNHIAPKGPLFLQKFRSPPFALPEKMDTTAGLFEVSKQLQHRFSNVYVR